MIYLDLVILINSSHGLDYVQLCISLATRYIWEYEGWKQKNTMDIDPGGKNTAVRTDDRMRRYYTKIAKRHGHSIAITHVANKMIRIMWYMLKNKKTYNDGKPDLYEKA